MTHEVEKRQKSTTDDADILSTARVFPRPTTIIDSNGQKHSFQKFEWLGKWGICNADKTKIIVEAKSNYLYVEILLYSQVLVAGDSHYGWDVYSLAGELLQHFTPMSFSKVTRLLDSKRRNS